MDSGVPVEGVRAVLRERGHNPALASRTAHEIKVRCAALYCALGVRGAVLGGEKLTISCTLQKNLADSLPPYEESEI